MTWIAGGTAVAAAGLVGVAMARRQGWDVDLHRMALVALLFPWVAQHASLARLARSASLNPLGRNAAEGPLLAGDWVAPAVLAAAAFACLAWPRRLRAASVLLPLLGSALVWWVTVPLYAGAMMRGWFFLTEGLAGPWPFVYHLAASAFLAGWVLPTLGATEPPESHGPASPEPPASRRASSGTSAGAPPGPR